jgi:hypothetical protein
MNFFSFPYLHFNGIECESNGISRALGSFYMQLDIIIVIVSKMNALMIFFNKQIRRRKYLKCLKTIAVLLLHGLLL